MNRYTPTFEDKEKLNELFKALRKAGYIARQNFSCCGSCASYELGEILKKKGRTDEKAVYYHRQDAEYFRNYGKVMLGWGGNGQEIADLARGLGIRTDWNGEDSRRIELNFRPTAKYEHTWEAGKSYCTYCGMEYASHEAYLKRGEESICE